MIDQDEKYQYSDIRSVTFNIKNHASVYPNPTDGHLNITGLSGNETIRVFDLTGKVLMKVDAKDQQGGMSLTGYSAGTYFVHITYVDGKTEIIKVEKIK
ncbi:MAG: T9SS type A sorting domain-containing protein [Candidatus Parvibacillus calidus]|nr:MAG: pectinesterase [Candidatus Parvibacillus calidus]QLH30259.1 MAG: T9SS type A sorting domain-containing protein [Candidatus Parvibacillus calidus]